MVKPYDPGKVCIPTRELPGGERALACSPLSVCGKPACACGCGGRARRKFSSRNKEDKEKPPGAARKLLSGLCPVGIPLPAHTPLERHQIRVILL